MGGRSAVVGAVDVGSNTVKLTVARRRSDGTLRVLAADAETVRLGAGLAERGTLAGDRVDAALVALTRFGEIARSHGATRLVGVATEATRRASNGGEFLRRVRDETGWDLLAISGEDEAALTFRGLAIEVDLAGAVVVADIGGGSTEVIHADDGVIRSTTSLRLGSGALTDLLVPADPPTVADVDACTAAALDILRQGGVAGGRGGRLIAVGGTGEYLARLVPDAHRVIGAEVETALARCREMPAAMLATHLGIQEARARVLPAGIAIVRALQQVLRPIYIEVARSGIRAGLLLDTFERMDREMNGLGEPAGDSGPRSIRNDD
ncbi:MAG: hypothetical protein M3462_09465 [Chloroflexota bacterium]|nr:hypothetical protein [Chloroflexota bacterium]